jgi:hypothetical protein
MARKRTAPRKRRTTAARRRAQAAPAATAAPKAPPAPSNGILTDQVLRQKLRRAKKPVINLFGGFGSAKEADEEKMAQIRASMR